MLTGSFSIGLAFLGSVNPCNANLVLLLSGVQDGKGVTVSDADNAVLQRGGLRQPACPRSSSSQPSLAG